MTFIVGLFTAVLVLDCLLLILLVLVQLPKKDAGIGMAFGGGAADALFGAGSGNALTKITKWATGIFFALALVLGLIEANLNKANTSSFEKALQQKQSQTTAPVQMPPTTPFPGAASTTTTNQGNTLEMPPTPENIGTNQSK